MPVDCGRKSERAHTDTSSTQKGPWWIRTRDLLAAKQQCGGVNTVASQYERPFLTQQEIFHHSISEHNTFLWKLFLQITKLFQQKT